jgi:hypothetical protein
MKAKMRLYAPLFPLFLAAYGVAIGGEKMLKPLLIFMCGAVIGAIVMWRVPTMGQASAKDQPKSGTAKADLDTLNDDVARLKNITPNLSHVMADVAFQYSNLWFAAQKKNWPLAMWSRLYRRSRLSVTARKARYE